MRRRLDVELVRRGLVASRARAVEAVERGRVLVGGAPAGSAARRVAEDEPLTVTDGPAEYVSRGGHKLAAALDAFGLDPAGRRVLDAGASTGGFTDCLLQRGAAEVVAVDVGRGQLAWGLRNDPRVRVLERTNVRTLLPAAIGGSVDMVVADLSFISLATVAPALLACAEADADFVLLVKPQFEAGRPRLGKGGVVRERAVHEEVLDEVVAALARAGLGVVGLAASPLLGPAGNIEFLAHARRGAKPVGEVTIRAAVAAAYDAGDAGR